MKEITKRKKAAIILKRTAVAAMCVILAAGMTACGKKADSVQSESVSENDKYSSDIFAMDTYMSLTAYGAKAEDAVTAAIHEIQRLDAMFSVGNTDSDVTTANMQGSATVSDETAYLVEQSLEISRKTDGAFVLQSIRSWSCGDLPRKIQSAAGRTNYRKR